jgi:preprotein translocase SecE subunit
MFAFWALLLLIAYGCFHGGGFAGLLGSWMGDSDRVLIDPFPILKTMKLSTLIALGVLVVAGFLIHRILNRPRLADTLIDTETELRKVTWPSWGEALHGTLAVTFMVLILGVFLTLVDLGLVALMQRLMGGA